VSPSTLVVRAGVSGLGPETLTDRRLRKWRRCLGGACFSRAVWRPRRRGWFGVLPPGVGSAGDAPFLQQGRAVVGLRVGHRAGE
jgi:hypothetical protein